MSAKYFNIGEMFFEMKFIYIVIVLISFSIIFEGCLAKILRLNESEYDKMPPLYAMDSHDECLAEPAGTYCVVDVDLLSSRPSPLLDVIKEYSSYTTKHFNHTQLHRAVCVTKTCKSYFGNVTLENAHDLQYSLQTCLNESLWNSYNLEATISSVVYCRRHGQKIEMDSLDVAMLSICCLVFILNLIGSSYDYLLKRVCSDTKRGNSYLKAFSFQRNWRKLVTSSNKSSDSSNDGHTINFHGIQGMRFLTMIAVMFSHIVLIISANYVENPLYIEKSFDDPLKQLLFNGSLVIQTYFSMASFLLAYNFLVNVENKRFSLWYLPKGIIHRWLRLTPLYALVIGVVASWSRYLGTGPQWPLAVTLESEACRRLWWTHILYFNNYIRADVTCMPQTWYLAADTQLFVYGMLLLMVLWKFPSSAKFLFSTLIIISIAIPGLITYHYHYYPIVSQSPESYRNIYRDDETFHNVYSLGHTNSGGYTIGILTAYIFYHFQKKNIDIAQFKVFRVLYHCVVPLATGFVLTGYVFYVDGYQYSAVGAAFYAGLYKNVFALLLNIFMLGMFSKVGKIYRACVEWQPFQVVGRLTYCAYLLHPIIQRGYVGRLQHPFYMNEYNIAILLAGSIAVTYILALLVSLAVEFPAALLLKLLLGTKNRAKTKKDYTDVTGEANNGANELGSVTVRL